MPTGKQYKGKASNTLFMVLLIGLFVYFIINAFDGWGEEVSKAEGLAYYYSDIAWTGVFASFVGSVIAFFNRSRGSQFLRGITIGFLIGSSVILLLLLIANV